MEKYRLVTSENFPNCMDVFHTEDKFNILAGPCSIESETELDIIAKALSANGVKIFRGGAYKPRSSPYDFQGLGFEGVKMMKEVCDRYSLCSVSEVMDVRDIELLMDYIDVFQIGSRNMSNTVLLKEMGKIKKPILLKRGFMATLEEFLMAAEYIVSNGNNNIVLCERGIRTFESSTRNTLDISTVALIKRISTLPVVVDLSHSLGRKDIILPIAKAIRELGADGIMLEVHNDPPKALSDSEQQLSIDEFQVFYDAFWGTGKEG